MRTMRVKSGLKAGQMGIWSNHSATKLKVKSGLKAGAVWSNRNTTKPKVKSGRVKTRLKVGLRGESLNHSTTRVRR